MSEIAIWYGNADLALARTLKQLAERGLKPPPVRCWPHHFDLDTLVIFPSKDIYDTRTMGVGFSPGDGYYGEPYLYVSLYPAPDVTMLPMFPMIGHWHEPRVRRGDRNRDPDRGRTRSAGRRRSLP